MKRQYQVGLIILLVICGALCFSLIHRGSDHANIQEAKTEQPEMPAVVEATKPKTITQQLPKGIECFKSSDGEYVAYGDFAKPLYFSADGKRFVQLHGVGTSWTFEDQIISFEDSEGKKGDIRRLKDKVTLADGKVFQKVPCPDESVEIVPLPERRFAVHFFRFPDKRFVMITADYYTESADSYKAYLGPKDKLEEIKITGRIQTYMDGGTTYIPTEKGVLYLPFRDYAKWRNEPHQKEEHYPAPVGKKWENVTILTAPDVRKYIIKEEKGIVRLTEKN